jgi:Ca2+-binding RTX toxin-like protein
VFGGQGDDTILSGAGSNLLYGNEGNDIFDGSAGSAETIIGGAGADTMTGSSTSANQYDFTVATDDGSSASGVDRITNF